MPANGYVEELLGVRGCALAGSSTEIDKEIGRAHV